MAGRSKEETAKEILSYFLRHPNAADSLEGVARWRLLQESVRRTVEETEEALRYLVEMGYLEAISSPAAGQIFRLKQEKRRSAERAVSGELEQNGSTDNRTTEPGEEGKE